MARRLYAHARLHAAGQHALLVFCRLLFKFLHAGHGNHAHLFALGGEQLLCAHAKLYLAAGAYEDYVGRALAVAEHIAAEQRLQARALVLGQVLAGEDDGGGAGLGECGDVCRRGLPSVAGAEYLEVGYRAQSDELFHRLMGGAVLAHAYRVVRHHVYHGYVHQRAHPYARLHIICKREECRAKRLQSAVQLYAVAYRRHRMFAYAVVHVAAQPVFRREVSRVFEFGLGGGGKVGGARDYVGHHLRDLRKHLAAARAGGFGLVEIEQPLYVFEVGLYALHEQLILRRKLGEGGLVLCKQLVPLLFRLQLLVGELHAVLFHVCGDGERFLRPAEELLGLCKVLLAHGCAVYVRRICKGRTVTYHRPAYNNGGACKVALRLLYRSAQQQQVVGVVYAQHLPALRGKPCGYVLGERGIGRALYGYFVAVV